MQRRAEEIVGEEDQKEEFGNDDEWRHPNPASINNELCPRQDLCFFPAEMHLSESIRRWKDSFFPYNEKWVQARSAIEQPHASFVCEMWMYNPCP